MRAGIHLLVTDSSRDMASLQLEMAERFVADLEASLLAAPAPAPAEVFSLPEQRELTEAEQAALKRVLFQIVQACTRASRHRNIRL